MMNNEISDYPKFHSVTGAKKNEIIVINTLRKVVNTMTRKSSERITKTKENIILAVNESLVVCTKVKQEHVSMLM